MDSDPNQPLFRDASPRTWALTKRFMVARSLMVSKGLARRLIHLGELADYCHWLSDSFGAIRLYRGREEMWQEQMLPRLQSGPVTGMEFGVAWGYATNWWLSRLRQEGVRWFGFDTFTGLPEKYRSHAPGQFSAQGMLPRIEDRRVDWVVGLAEDTLPRFHYERGLGERLLLFFDFDLFKPSREAWLHFESHLQGGDLLYFDEAYDSNERRLLNEFVLPHHEVRALGATTTALALEYLGRR